MFFKKKRIPIIGESWTLKKDDSPWPSKGIHPITILDVRDGWVRYDMGPGLMFRDERLQLSAFLNSYKPITEDKV